MQNTQSAATRLAVEFTCADYERLLWQYIEAGSKTMLPNNVDLFIKMRQHSRDCPACGETDFRIVTESARAKQTWGTLSVNGTPFSPTPYVPAERILTPDGGYSYLCRLDRVSAALPQTQAV